MRSDLEERIRLLERYTGQARFKARTLDQRIGFLEQWAYIIGGGAADAGKPTVPTGWITNTCCPDGIPPTLNLSYVGGSTTLTYQGWMGSGSIFSWTNCATFNVINSVDTYFGFQSGGLCQQCNAADVHSGGSTAIRYRLNCSGGVWQLSAYYFGAESNPGSPVPVNGAACSLLDDVIVGNPVAPGGNFYCIFFSSGTLQAGFTKCPPGLNLDFRFTGPGNANPVNLWNSTTNVNIAQP